MLPRFHHLCGEQPRDPAFDIYFTTDAQARKQKRNSHTLPTVDPNDSNREKIRNDQQPDLSNEIHPIYRHENFLDLPAEKYDSMKLGLQLASRFLTDEGMLQWWLHAAFDDEVRGDDADTLLHHRTTYTRVHLRQLRAALVEMAECVRFSFDSAPGNVGQTQLKKLKNKRGAVPRPGAKTNIKFFRHDHFAAIDLHPQFYDYAGLDYAADSVEAQLRHSLLLAITLTHELAHAFAMLGFRSGARIRSREPLCCVNGVRDVESELGASWEWFAFGGRLFPCSIDHVGPTSFLTAHMWRPEVSDCKCVKTVAPIVWVAAWFQDKLWNAYEKRFLLSGPSPDGAVRVWSNPRGHIVFEYPDKAGGEARRLAEKDNKESVKRARTQENSDGHGGEDGRSSSKRVRR